MNEQLFIFYVIILYKVNIRFQLILSVIISNIALQYHIKMIRICYTRVNIINCAIIFSCFSHFSYFSLFLALLFTISRAQRDQLSGTPRYFSRLTLVICLEKIKYERYHSICLLMTVTISFLDSHVCVKSRASRNH